MIDDDHKLCQLIGEYLEPFGYRLTFVHNGPDGVETARARNWHTIIIDLMLPGMDGFEVLKRIRKFSEDPILMLTARGEEADRIVGLELGADDYLPKTFSTRELLARLRAVARRRHQPVPATPGPAEAESIEVGALSIFPQRRSASLEGRPLQLTPVEFDLLVCLARARGRVRSREQLLEEIRDRNYDIYDRSIDVHISALRKKLGDDPRHPRYIKTLRTAGYMFVDPDRE